MWHINKENYVSKIALLLLLIVCAWYGRNLNTWGKDKIIRSDVVSYYGYLPAALIFNDLTFSFATDLPDDFEGTIWVQTAPNGKYVLRMTMGLAILWLPFFLAAHLFAFLADVSSLGYSWPYSLSIFLAALFYLGIGLFYLRKILLKYVPDIIAGITLMLIVLATNLMYYVISEPGMSHVYNFALISLFVYKSIQWAEKPKSVPGILLGVLAGIIVLIRPVNIIILIFPALYGILSLSGFFNRIIQNCKQIIVAGISALLVWLPQMIYWKIQTGHLFFNSYMNEGKFFFLKPEIINGLFSYRKGWLLYTPVMILALAGIPFLWRKAQPLFFPVLLFTLVNIYIVYSWWAWWYGGGFGSRPMIDMYGIMAVPLAIIIQKAVNSKKWIKWGTIILITCLLFFNQFQMTQYRKSLLHWDSMTKEAYWNVFLRKYKPDGFEHMLRVPNYDKALKGEKE